MSRSTLWNAIRSTRDSAAGAERRIVLQHLMLSDRDLGMVRAVLEKVGEQLAMTFDLAEHGGEIVLVDGDLAARISPQLVLSLAEERPVVTLTGLHCGGDLSLTALELFERRQCELRRQLEALPLVRHRRGLERDAAQAAPASVGADAADPGQTLAEFDSGFDSRHDERVHACSDAVDELALLHALLRGVFDPATPALTASYGPEANLRLDFRTRLAIIDPLALQPLRLQRELPRRVPATRPQPCWSVRDLDLAIWDLGMAAGSVALLDAPDDWWHAPLLAPPTALIGRYSAAPRHLEMARRLQIGPVTPSELRRQARVSVAELRSFLQACLLTRLAHWQAPPPQRRAS